MMKCNKLCCVLGSSVRALDKMDLASLGDEELQEIVRKRLLRTGTNDSAKEKAVSVSEVNKYLAQGWEYVASLPNKTVIIRSKK